MRFLYCYIQFLDNNGNETQYHGLSCIELNMSTIDKYTYNSASNILERKGRRMPLPKSFWLNSNTQNTRKCTSVYNINVIAGENGSGKTTAIRCIMDLLDFLYHKVDKPGTESQSNITFGIARNRLILLFEDDGHLNLLLYYPAKWNGERYVRKEGFPERQFNECVCDELLLKEIGLNAINDKIATLLLKTKIIYMNNTLNQYDYERHISGSDLHLDSIIYDVSAGSTISQGVRQYFNQEVYKQVRYIFDEEQVKRRKNIPEITLPRALSLRLRIEEYEENVDKSFFASVINHVGENNLITFFLEMLCIAAFAKKTGTTIKNDLYTVSHFKAGNNTHDKLKQMISELEEEYYYRTMPEGHHNTISCVVCLPDGDIVSGSKDGTLRRWDTEIGICKRVFMGHTGAINCVIYLPSGYIVSGSDDGTLRVWDPTLDESLLTLTGHKSWVTCMTNLSERQVVSGSRDGTLRIWDVITGECLFQLIGHTDGVTCVDVLPNKHIVSGSRDGTLRVWDSNTGKCLRTIKGHVSWISCIDVLPNGFVVSGSDDKTLRIWDPDTGECLHILVNHQGRINCVTVYKNGSIFSGSDDGTIREWDSASGECLRTLKGHEGWVTCLVAYSDTQIISGSNDREIRVWSIDKNGCLPLNPGHTGQITCITTLPSGKIISGSFDETLRIVSLSSDDSKVIVLPISKRDNTTYCFSDQKQNNIAIHQWKKEHKEIKAAADRCQEYIDYLKEKNDSLFSNFNRIDLYTYEILLSDKILSNDEIVTKNKVYTELAGFVQKYSRISDIGQTVDFDWGLSSGEENMLRIFSNLYHLFDRNNNALQENDHSVLNNEIPFSSENHEVECETILLFMDEADLTLHPEWQRRLIAILTEFVPQVYSSTCIKDIQLILTTHSPLLLGDIPEENITYMFAKKTKEKMGDLTFIDPAQTFGQNIHTILKNNFFLSNGTIGAFAAGKINTTAKRLNRLKTSATGGKHNKHQLKQELVEERQIINLVSPGVLRTKLEMLYHEVEEKINILRDEKEKTKEMDVDQKERLKQVLRQLQPEEIQEIMNELKHEGYK